MNNRYLKFIPALLLVVVTGIMVFNVYSHPVKWGYDYKIHMDAFRLNAESGFMSSDMPAGLEYNPPLYYYLIGKSYKIWSSFFITEPQVFVKLFHYIFFILIYSCFVFLVLPVIVTDRLKQVTAALMFISVPNIYLSMVMPRADHLFFFTANLLFALWVLRGGSSGFKSISDIFIFGLLLAAMANTRHIAGGAWGIMFLLFLYGVIRNFRRSEKTPGIPSLIWVLLVFIMSGLFYFNNFIPEILGKKVVYAPENQWIDVYHAKYRKLGERMGIEGRLGMFSNFRFDKLFESPNRKAVFSDIEAVDEFDMEFFRREIFFKIKKREDRKLLLNCYKKDYTKNKYVLRSNIPRKTMLEYKSVLYGVLNLGNSFWPRLYGDMWGDHWLYFSGRKGEDVKTGLKKLVFILALPFTLLYFGLPVYYSMKGIRSVFKKRLPEYAELAGSIFVLGLLMLIAFVWMDPETGKNSTVKFTYILGYSLFPFYCIINWLNMPGRRIKLFSVYMLVLFMVALPLNIFWI